LNHLTSTTGQALTILTSTSRHLDTSHHLPAPQHFALLQQIRPDTCAP
jgi:hypothetical protein